MQTTEIRTTPTKSQTSTRTRELVALALWIALLLVTSLWGQAHLDADPRMKIGVPPIYGKLSPTITRMIVLPAAVAIAVLWFLPRHTGSRRRLLIVSCVAAAAWGIALALASDGELIGSLEHRPDYLRVVGLMPSPGSFLDSFAQSLTDYPIHVQGHPPAFPLLLWIMDRIGMPGTGWAAGLMVVSWASIPAAILMVLWDVSGETMARRAAPFLVLMPGAIWAVSSGDALFAALGAWAIALVVVSSRRTGVAHALWGIGAGLVAGIGLYASYGLGPLMIVPVALCIYRRSYRTLAWAAAGALAVAGAFALSGFWWFDGLAATKVRYEAGVSAFRPYSYFVVANLGALAVALGPAVAAGLARLKGWRDRDGRGAWVIVGAALVAVIASDLSGLSKGEAERIWLPFGVWLSVACGAIAAKAQRSYVALQAMWAIGIQMVVLEPW